MEKLDLEATERKEKGKKNAAVRRQGFVPAVIYGHGMTALSIAVPGKIFSKAIASAASSNVIINLKVGTETYPVITQEVQTDPTTDQVLHIDFLLIRMDEAIKAKVHIELKGIPIGVKDDGGILVQTLRELEIKCLPDKIPGKIELDVTALKIGDGFSVSDLKGYEGIEFLTPANEPIVHVEEPAKEEEVAPTVAPVEGAVPVEGAAVPATGEAAPAKAAAPEAAKTAAKPAAKPAKEAKK